MIVFNFVGDFQGGFQCFIPLRGTLQSILRIFLGSVYIHSKHSHLNISKCSYLQLETNTKGKNTHTKTFEEVLCMKRVRICTNTAVS